MAGEAASRTSVTLAFQRRRDLEWRKLRKHLHLQLQQDIARIYSNSLYCDLELVFDSTTIQTHSSILQVRAARFFTKLCTTPTFASLHNGLHSVALEKASVEFIKSFIRNIYTKCAINEEETEALQYLERLNGSRGPKESSPIPCKVERGGGNDSGLSPESDVYLTPNCSPSEIYSSFGSCNSVEAVNVPTTIEEANEPIANLHKTNRSYYSIVPIDEVYSEEQTGKSLESDVLEKELAEQDELLKSFESIKSKEEKKIITGKKLKKPTSLPFSSSHYAKKQKRGCDITLGRDRFIRKDRSIHDSKIQATLNVGAVSDPVAQLTNKECTSENTLKANALRKDKHSLDRFDYKGNTIKEEEESENIQDSLLCCFSCRNHSGLYPNKSEKNNCVSHNDLLEEDDEFMCSPAEGVDCGLDCCKKKELIVEDLLTFPCSPEMDASGGGPDSGLDTSSTGCMPGGGFSSPREHTVSETSGVDLTEAAIGEDMPHDGDAEPPMHKPEKSSASSSVSSDAGTWDSTFPPPNNNEIPGEGNQKCITKTDIVVDASCTGIIDGTHSFKEPLGTICHEDNTKVSQDPLPSLEGEVPAELQDNVNKQKSDTDLAHEQLVTKDTKSHEEVEIEREKVKKSSSAEDDHSCTTADLSKEHYEDAANYILDATECDALKDVSELTEPTDSGDFVIDKSEHSRKISSLGDLQTEYLVDSHQPSSGEKCSEWKIDVNAGGGHNYFINAATLVDDNELPSSLPPLYIHEIGYKAGVSTKDKQDVSSEQDAPKVTTTTCPPDLSTESELQEASKVEVVNVQHIVSEPKEAEETRERAPSRAADENILQESPIVKCTFLKMGGTRLETKVVNGQDIIAEFQKEIKLTEHLEPQPIVRKVHLERRRWDSYSEDMAKRDDDSLLPRNNDVLRKQKSADSQDTSTNYVKKEAEIPHKPCAPINQELEVSSNDMEQSDLQTKDFNVNSEMNEAQDSDFAIKEEKSTESESAKPTCDEHTIETVEVDGQNDQRRPSLIRRNTFELDPDDDRLALLRQEYERRQGNLLFQNCIPQFSGHITGSEGFRDTQSMLVVGSGKEEVNLSEEQQKSLPSIPIDSTDPSSRDINPDKLFPVVGMHTSQHVHYGPVSLFSDKPLNNLFKGEEILISQPDCQTNLLSPQSITHNKEEFTSREELKEEVQNVIEEIKEPEEYQEAEYLKRMSSSYDNSSKPVISGALTCSDVAIEEKWPWDSPKKQKRTESTPIVSGGVSTVDFSVPVRRVSESPIMRRKNESAPILSGAAPVSPPPKEMAEVKPTPPMPGASAWVVDMSDCSSNGNKPPIDSKRHKKSDSNVTAVASAVDHNEKIVPLGSSPKCTDVKSTSLGFFVELSDSLPKDPQDHKVKETGHETKVPKTRESVPPSVGYFVGLDEPRNIPKDKWEKKSSSFEESREILKRQTSKNEELRSGKNSPCGFFVDLTPTDSSSGRKDAAEDRKKESVEEKDTTTPEKKTSLFSMFIDIGDNKQDSTSKFGGSTESVKSKVASSPLLSAQKKLAHRRASLTRGDIADKGSKITGTTFDVDDESQHTESPKGTFMYIDASKRPVSKQTSSSQSSSQDEIKEQKETKKQGFFMFIETESPVTRRKTLPSGLRPNFNRHSWNPESRNNLQTEEQRISSRRQHKRAHSLSVDRSSISSPGDEHKSSSSGSLVKSRLQGSSSQSLHESNMPSDIGAHPQMSTSCHARLSSKCHDKFVKRALSVEGKIENEIDTISEGKALTDSENHAKDRGSHKIKTSGNIDLKFALQEANVGILKISDFECAEEFTVKKVVQVPVHDKTAASDPVSSDASQEKHAVLKVEVDNGKIPSNTHKVTKLLVTDVKVGTSKSSRNVEVVSDQQVIKATKNDKDLETGIEKANKEKNDKCKLKKEYNGNGSFVKLSDLDKEPPKTSRDFSDSDVLPSFATANRMTRSIPETSWIENKLLMTRSIGGATTSRSLSRLFPHLHTTITATSSPSSLVHSKSPGGQTEADDNDTQMSETSDLSSMQSSMGPSGLEGSTEETDASSSYAGRSGPVSRLGEDLLRMFLEEINPDVTVEVGGRRLKAHKCILSSRCQYFAAMLSGGWVESAGNVISLQGFSYNAVHFALCHIYSGTSNIPDTISIVELATLADMLGLEGLKEVIMYTLKVKYCHFFHKPCAMCAVGVLECLPLAAAYGLDDIYRKSLRWITKYFVRIWPTKGFASLPRELIEKCYQQHVVHMSVDNILETVMCCDKLLATLPNVRWAEPVFGITSQLLEASIKFIANNFCGVLTSENFLSLGKELSWNISRLEDSIMAATDRLPPDQACQSHARLHQILIVAQAADPPPEMQWSQSFVELLSRIQKRVEASLVRQAPRAARCQSWSQMEPELRKKIQEAACLVLVPGEEGHRSRHASLARRGQASGSSSVYCTGPRSVSSSGSRNLDLRQVKLAMTQQARRAASGGRVSTLKADSKTKMQPKQPPPPPLKKEPDENGKVANGETAPRPKTWPMRVLETKTRSSKYRANSSNSSTGTPEKSTSVPRRTGKTMISSSDSSRTSSPAMRRSTPGSEGSGRGRTSTVGSSTGHNAKSRT